MSLKSFLSSKEKFPFSLIFFNFLFQDLEEKILPIMNSRLENAMSICVAH